MDEICVMEKPVQTGQDAVILPPMMAEMMKLVESNISVMEKIRDALDMQNERIAYLERTVKRRMPVTAIQVRYMNEAIRNRTHALLDGKDGIDGKAYAKLARCIRRDVMVRCGVASLRDMPDHEYGVSMDQIRMWSDALVIRDVVKEARERVEAMADTEQAAGVDGA